MEVGGGNLQELILTKLSTKEILVTYSVAVDKLSSFQHKQDKQTL